MINYRSYNDLVSIVKDKINILPKNIDLVVGIPRSGMIPAYMIANLIDCGAIDFYSFLRNEEVRGGARFKNREKKAFEFKNVLFFDDSIMTGKALTKIQDQLDETVNNLEMEISYGVVYATEISKLKVDYFFEIVEYPRLFQWNIFNHLIIENSCFDLDGVLCYDVPEEFNDDGEKYIKYIETVQVYIKPIRPIKKIVTCRLEKYRHVTENWLEKNEIIYEELIMLQLSNGEERRRWNKHGEYKAEIFKTSNSELFIESSYNQAVLIAECTGKSVYCVDSNQMIGALLESKQSNLLIRINRKTFLNKLFKRIRKGFIT
jgi:uncharacterized HAD superfamily protein/hypoxanthine phosphoribosyltransferase